VTAAKRRDEALAQGALAAVCEVIAAEFEPALTAFLEVEAKLVAVRSELERRGFAAVPMPGAIAAAGAIRRAIADAKHEPAVQCDLAVGKQLIEQLAHDPAVKL
jgi:hypothetical protein